MSLTKEKKSELIGKYGRADGDTGSLADAFGQEDERFELVDASVTIAASAHQLTPRERHVLALRFVQDMTQTQIAEEIGVSQMQVSRILRGATARLTELTAPAAEMPRPLRRAECGRPRPVRGTAA